MAKPTDDELADHRKHRVDLLYFDGAGNHKGGASYRTHQETLTYIAAEVEGMVTIGGLPELPSGTRYHILVSVPNLFESGTARKLVLLKKEAVTE